MTSSSARKWKAFLDMTNQAKEEDSDDALNFDVERDKYGNPVEVEVRGIPGRGLRKTERTFAYLPDASEKRAEYLDSEVASAILAQKNTKANCLKLMKKLGYPKTNCDHLTGGKRKTRRKLSRTKRSRTKCKRSRCSRTKRKRSRCSRIKRSRTKCKRSRCSKRVYKKKTSRRC